MVAVPEATPVTTPLLLPTVAIEVSVVLHVPPLAVLASVVLRPSQTLAVPVIAGGNAFTVTTAEVLHPPPRE
jgi:hypothetical protein